jgi:hypothetical protein
MGRSARSSRMSRCAATVALDELRFEVLKPNHDLWIDPPSHWVIVISQEAAPPRR